MSIFTSTTPTWAPLPIRLVLGMIMIVHGAQKVFGVWGGEGFNAWISQVAPLNLRPSWLWLALFAFFELIGGLLVLIGLYTRIGALMIALVMLYGIFIQLRNGFFVMQGGYEYVLALFAMAVSLMISGAGNLSLDLSRSK